MDPICWCPEKHAVQYTVSVEASPHTGKAVLVVVRMWFGEEKWSSKW